MPYVPLNYGWNGSTLTFGGNGVTPLTDLHQPNDPADFDTTGSTDTVHSHGVGLPKNSFTASCLGSNIPRAGTVIAIVASIAGGSSATTKTYAEAMISQMSITGRKDGRIESNLTVMPGVTALTPIAYTPASPTSQGFGFNGSTFSLGSTLFNAMVSATYSSSAQAVECSGAGDTDNLYAPGLLDETLTITCFGGPQATQGTTGASAMTWNDGGTLGSATKVVLQSVHPGGMLDGQTTTEYVFKVSK